MCRERIPPKSNWHVDHVLAFSADPRAHDVKCNMLPTHAKCNLAKSNKTLSEIVQSQELTLGTDIIDCLEDKGHMNKKTLDALHKALGLKHRMRFKHMDKLCELRNSNDPCLSTLTWAISEVTSMDKHFMQENARIPRFSEEDLVGGNMRKLSKGKFGLVYKATMHINAIETSVALKKLINDDEKLEQEAFYLARLENPNIVKVSGLSLKGKAHFPITYSLIHHFTDLWHSSPT